MSKETTSATWPHQDYIKDNNLSLTELPQKTQDLIAKFSALTDKDAQEAMDEKIYGQVDDYLEAKVAKEKMEKVKGKIAEQKKKKTTLDVSGADTAKTPEQEAAEKKAAEEAANKPKSGGLMSKIYPGRK